MSHLGDAIREAREGAGRSIRELAKDCGTSHASLSMVEDGQRIMGYQRVVNLERIMGFPHGELVAAAELDVAEDATWRWRSRRSR